MKKSQRRTQPNQTKKKKEGKNHICKLSGAKENGLLGKSGVLGLNALANNSSPESELLDVPAIEPIDANPLLPSLTCCWTWIDSGG